ncbi:MAG TPA: hemerythrin domain-containing protein [Candidatus Thermoplasmatota archaeon]|nr:hemerythrin domain-containing protein [Candidatus Thermoplasmatota archaeon]
MAATTTRTTKARTTSSRRARPANRTSSSTGILADLRADHKKVRKLLKQLEDAEEATEQRELFTTIYTELMVHAKLEEQVFYPAYKDAVEAAGIDSEKDEEKRALFFEAAEEHASVEILLEKMKAGAFGSDEFCAQAVVLKEQVEHHADEEEEEMFPAAAKVMDRVELEALRAQAEPVRESLMMEYGGQLPNARVR